MRILMAATGVEGHGGIQRFNRNLLRAWRELGIDVDVVSVNDAPLPNGLAAVKVGVTIYGAGRSKARWLTLVSRLLLTRRYDRFVCGHIHLASAFALLLATAGAPWGERFLILHGVEVWGRVTGSKRAASKRYGRVLAVSQYTAKSFLEQAPEFPADRVTIFPNTIGAELPPQTLSAGTATGTALKVITVSRLARSEREKGIVDLIAAAAEISRDTRVEITVVGDGDDRMFLEARARALGVADRVFFRGALSDQDLWRAYAEADVFALPSRKEGFGIVYLEAMWFGLPVIAAREKGALDVVRDRDNGFLVPYGDPFAIAACLRSLTADPALGTQLGEQGRELVSPGGEFSFETFRNRCRQWFLDTGQKERAA